MCGLPKKKVLRFRVCIPSILKLRSLYITSGYPNEKV